MLAVNFNKQTQHSPPLSSAAILQAVQQLLLAVSACHLHVHHAAVAGKVQIIAVHSKAKNGTFYHEHQLHLQLKNGEMKRLLFPTEPTKVSIAVFAVACAFILCMLHHSSSAALCHRVYQDSSMLIVV